MVNGNYKIGLNETALGIITTPWMQAVMYQVIPKKDAERALTTAKMFNVDEAFQVSLGVGFHCSNIGMKTCYPSYSSWNN